MFNHSSRGRQKRLSAEREEMEQRIGAELLSTVAEPLELEPEPEPEAHSAPQLAAPEVVEMPPQHTELGGGFGIVGDGCAADREHLVPFLRQPAELPNEPRLRPAHARPALCTLRPGKGGPWGVSTRHC